MIKSVVAKWRTQGGVKRSTSKGKRAGQVSSVPGLSGAKTVWIPPGSFTMGSPKSEPGRDRTEGPQTRVRLTRGFWLWRTEVTQGQFERLMGYNPSKFKLCGSNCPVEQVSWHESAAFCNALSRKLRLPRCFSCSGRGRTVKCRRSSRYSGKTYLTCRGYRLPTEAEWERAARAGTSTALYTGKITIRGRHNAPELDKIGWYGGNSGVRYRGGYDCSRWKQKHHASSRCGTHPVAAKLANRWGLFDMIGNVWEWTATRWRRRHPGGSVTDPVGPSTGSVRVFRGGSWSNYARNCRAAFRAWSRPSSRGGDFLGFRPLRSGP